LVPTFHALANVLHSTHSFDEMTKPELGCKDSDVAALMCPMSGA
jgi:hypothetical protein